MAQALRHHLETAQDVAIAVPFFDLKGLKMILPALRKRSRVRILLGLSSDGFNDPACLRILLDASKKLPSAFQVRISKGLDRLHEKLYLASSGKSSHAIVGSSNLTLKGLTKRSELSVHIGADSRHAKLVRELWEYFDASFHKDSVPLTRSILLSYGRLRAGVRMTQQLSRRKAGKDMARLRNLLGKAEDLPRPTERTWYSVLTRPLRDSVGLVVEQRTGWKDPYFACVKSERSFFDRVREGDEVVFLDKSRPKSWRVELVQVLERAVLRVRGLNWFVRYKELRNHSWNAKARAAFDLARITTKSEGKVLARRQIRILANSLRWSKRSK